MIRLYKRYYPVKTHYRWHPGFIAWVLHRLSGLALAGYLFLHIWVLAHLTGDGEGFKRLMAAFDHPLIRVMEIGLLGLVLFHMVNGVRIFFMDYGNMSAKGAHLKYLWGAMAIVLILFFIGAGFMIKTILG